MYADGSFLANLVMVQFSGVNPLLETVGIGTVKLKLVSSGRGIGVWGKGGAVLFPHLSNAELLCLSH